MTDRIASRCVCCGSCALARSPAVLMPFVAERVFGWTPVEITPDWGLRTIRTGMAYPLCNSVECQDCGLLFMDIRFSDGEMAALYRDYRGADYVAGRERLEPGYAALNAAILALSPDTSDAEAFLRPHLACARPRVLDWGGDTGANTPFRAAASAADVYDISERPVVAGVRRVGPDDLKAARYDLVVLSHVLEHVPEPAEVLAPAAERMAQDGILYVEVPFETLIAESGTARGLAPRKRYWHEHINFFTEASLRALLARSGLEVMALETRSLQSLANISRVLTAACRRQPA